MVSVGLGGKSRWHPWVWVRGKPVDLGEGVKIDQLKGKIAKMRPGRAPEGTFWSSVADSLDYEIHAPLCNENEGLKGTTDNKRIIEEIENFERNFFRHRDKPSKICQRCDACRAIAYKLDVAFEIAEYQVGIKGYPDEGKHPGKYIN